MNEKSNLLLLFQEQELMNGLVFLMEEKYIQPDAAAGAGANELALQEGD